MAESAAVVRSRSGVSATTWSISVTPLRWAPDSSAPTAGPSAQPVGTPSTLGGPARVSVQPRIPGPSARPTMRRRTPPTWHVPSPSTRNPEARQASGSSPTASSAISTSPASPASIDGTLLRRAEPDLPAEEGVDVGRLLGLLGRRLPLAVAGPRLDPDQDRVLVRAGGGGGQGGAELAGVGGVDPAVG